MYVQSPVEDSSGISVEVAVGYKLVPVVHTVPKREIDSFISVIKSMYVSDPEVLDYQLSDE